MNIIASENISKYNGSDSIYFVKSPIDFFVKAHGSYMVKTGIKVYIPSNEVLEIVSVPVMKKNYGLSAEGFYFPAKPNDNPNDPEFKELFIQVSNNSRVSHSIKAGDQIALIIPLLTAPVYEIDSLVRADNDSDSE